MTTTTRNEAAERLRKYLDGFTENLAPEGPRTVDPFPLLDEALAAAKAEGAREALERIRARVDAQPVQPNDTFLDMHRYVTAILDEEASR